MNKHFIMTDNEGTSSIETGNAPEFAAADYAGWSSILQEGVAGVFLFMFKIEPGAEEYPMHAAPDEFLGYVVSGGGELFSGTPEGEKRDCVSFTAGDLITFKPNTQHAWKNGPEETKIMFLKAS